MLADHNQSVAGRLKESAVFFFALAKGLFGVLQVGDFHRLLLPGLYDLRVESTGYHAREVYGVAVADGEATVVDVTLDKKYQRILAKEVRCEEYRTEDAELMLINGDRRRLARVVANLIGQSVRLSRMVAAEQRELRDERDS